PQPPPPLGDGPRHRPQPQGGRLRALDGPRLLVLPVGGRRQPGARGAEPGLMPDGAERPPGGVEPNFTSRGFSVGVEGGLMILDAGTLDLVNAIEQMLGDVPVGEVKPELLESVLEISTDPCSGPVEAADQLRSLRHAVAERAGGHGLAIGSAGTPPCPPPPPPP